MSDNEADEFQVVVEASISKIGKAAWDACLAEHPSSDVQNGTSAAARQHPVNPFVTYDFLHSLEASGCVCSETGWLPQHLTLRNKAGDILAVMPAYLKSHSMGEYVFDHAWAQAFESAGGDYYPKLQCAVPFTPVTGPRILIRPDIDKTSAIAALSGAAMELTRIRQASSAHITFVSQDQTEGLQQAGYFQRTDRQFHWHNDTYPNFDEFLATLTSRKRKAIRKERARALHGDGLENENIGIEIEWLTGDQITPEHWDVFFRFYLDTGERKWGTPYLTREFFAILGDCMADDILLIMAKIDGDYIAGAMNMIGATALYGRYWGCLAAHDFLHFEVCYYQAMDYAIEHGLEWVEAGAQGEHKLARGYLPVVTHSAHFIRHPGLANAVAGYLEGEREYSEMERDALAKLGPYRKDALNKEDSKPITSGPSPHSHE